MELFKLLGTICVQNVQANKAIDDTVAKAGGAGTAFGKVGKTIAKVGAGIGVAAGAVGAFAVKAASDYETNFAKVSTLLTGNEQEIQKYKQKLLDASTETGVAADEMSEAVYSAISASVNQNDAIEFAKQASQLAKGGFTETATAVDVMTTAINAYGLKASDATKVSDMLINTQNLGKTTVDELASSMGKIIPTANSYGVKLDVLCGMYAETTKNGIATAESTTYMNSMLNELGKSGTTASTVLKEKTGKSFKELMDSGVSLTDVLGILQDEADKSGKSMGDMFGSAEAGKAATVLSSNAKDLNKNIKSMGKSSGTTQKAATKMADTVQAKVKKLKTQVNNAMVQIGNKILPIISNIFNSVQKKTPAIKKKIDSLMPSLQKIGNAVMPMVSKAFKIASDTISACVKVVGDCISFFKQHSTLSKTLAGAIGGVTTAMIAYKAVTIAQNALEKIKFMWLQLSIAKLALQEGVTLKAALAQAELNVAMSANPIGLLVAGIGLLVGTLVTYAATTNNAKDEQNGLTEAQKKNKKAVDELAQSRKDAQQAADSEVSSVKASFGHYQALWEELQKNVDVNGKIKKGYEDRAKFIVSTLSEALGIEISITDGVIKKYKKLGDSIDSLIEKKRAEAVLNANEDNYQEAINNKKNALTEYVTAQDNYTEAHKKTTEAIEAESAAQKKKNELWKDWNGNDRAVTESMREAKSELTKAKQATDEARQAEEGFKDTLKKASDEWTNVNTTIQNYEGLSEAIISGDAKKINKAMSDMTNNFIKAENGTRESMARQTANASINYSNMKKAYKKGAAGVTKEMVVEAKNFRDKAKKEEEKYREQSKSASQKVMDEEVDIAKKKVTKVTSIHKSGKKKSLQEIKDPKGFKNAEASNMDGYIEGAKSKKQKVGQTTKSVANHGKEKLKVDTHPSGVNFSQGFIGGILSLIGKVANAAGKLATKATNSLKKTQKEGSPSKITTQSGKYFGQGFVNGIASSVGKVVLAVSKLGGSAVDTLNKSLDEHSPSRKTLKSGLNFVLGMANGILRNISLVTKSINKLSKEALSALKKTMKAKDYENKGKEIVEKLGKGFASRIDSFKSKVQSLKDSTKSELESIYSEWSSFSEKMTSVDLFTKNEETGEISLVNLKSQTKKLENYRKNLNKLEGEISDELMGEIIDMDADDGIAFTNKLLALSDSELSAYNKQYTNMLKAGDNVAKNYYAKQMKSVKENYADKMEKLFKKIVKSLSNFGKNAVEGFMKAFGKNSKVNKTLTDFCNNIVKQVQNKLKIHSPSQVFRDKVGKFIALGIAEGITGEESAVNSSLERLTNPTVPNIRAGLVNSISSSQTNCNAESDIKKSIDDFKKDMYSIIVSALSDGVRMKWDDREIGRLVKNYAR